MRNVANSPSELIDSCSETATLPGMSKRTTDFDQILAHEEPGFRRSVKAIITGDVEGLRELLTDHPDLITARSSSEHHSTLLHYVAANGIEDELQRTPANAVEIARCLLEAGAEVDAVCGTYGGGSAQTTLSLLVSSGHPAEAGVQADLTRLLIEAGAAVDGLDGDGTPLMTALAFGYPQTAAVLVELGARCDNIVFAAAAGRLDLVQGYFDENKRVKDDVGHWAQPWFQISSNPDVAAEQALVFAGMCGQRNIVALFLGRGIDVNCQPPGTHVTATPLHTAAWQGRSDVVQLLLDRGADASIRDERHDSKAADWAANAGHAKTALLINSQ